MNTPTYYLTVRERLSDGAFKVTDSLTFTDRDRALYTLDMTVQIWPEDYDSRGARFQVALTRDHPLGVRR